MKKENLSAKIGYGFSYSELLMKARVVSELVRRDIDKFKRYSVDLDRVTAFDQKIKEMQKLPTDVVMEVKKINATLEKHRILDELKAGLKNLIFLSKFVYKDKQECAKAYIVGYPSKMTEHALTHHVQALADLTKENIKDFEHLGVTIGYCDELLAKNEGFIKCYNKITKNIQLRDKATQNRWLKAAEVYNEMKFFSDLGKFIWETEGDEAYYNDYILKLNYYSSKTEPTVKVESPTTNSVNDNG